MDTKIEKATLSLKLIDAIAQYLAQRPYAEVFQLLQGIQAEVVPQVNPAQATQSPQKDLPSAEPEGAK